MAQLIHPDPGFVRELQACGGETLKRCYQCATCSVACPLAPANNPYPRKEMVWASWGLRDKLMNDADLWLCHNCGTCAELCPRGARPADLMAAARNMVYRELVAPSLIGKWMSSVRGLPFLIAVPAALWLLVWALRAGIKGSWFPRTFDGRIVFGEIFYGDYTIDPIFIITFFGSLFLLWRGTAKLLRRFRPEGAMLMLGRTKPWYLHLKDVLLEEVITHKKFRDCGEDKADRRIGHMAVFYSFVALAVVTAVVAGGHWLGKIVPFLDVPTPMPLTFPVKILANAGAIGLFFGLAVMTLRRLKLNPKYQASAFYDWYLLGVIWAVALTGMLAQIFRLLDCAPAAFSVYYLHLVAVWMLFAYLPWSKLGHFVYRVAALTYVRAIGRR
jgi:quinone-modifying oxidoreductase subunit QmoC